MKFTGASARLLLWACSLLAGSVSFLSTQAARAVDICVRSCNLAGQTASFNASVMCKTNGHTPEDCVIQYMGNAGNGNGWFKVGCNENGLAGTTYGSPFQASGCGPAWVVTK